MMELTQKDRKFDWGEEQETTFQLLKQKLCAAPILALPEGSDDFVVYCDASITLVRCGTNAKATKRYCKNKGSAVQLARDLQKSYADKRRRPLEFEVGEKVMLKVAPWKGVIQFRKRGKLNPRYIGPFQIIERIGPVAYRLELPQELSRDLCCSTAATKEILWTVRSSNSNEAVYLSLKSVGMHVEVQNTRGNEDHYQEQIPPLVRKSTISYIVLMSWMKSSNLGLAAATVAAACASVRQWLAASVAAVICGG
ncbi:putative reverse transcriptase domain-containing protein [Tanacetum coccineum]